MYVTDGDAKEQLAKAKEMLDKAQQTIDELHVRRMQTRFAFTSIAPGFNCILQETYTAIFQIM